MNTKRCSKCGCMAARPQLVMDMGGQIRMKYVLARPDLEMDDVDEQPWSSPKTKKPCTYLRKKGVALRSNRFRAKAKIVNLLYQLKRAGANILLVLRPRPAKATTTDVRSRLSASIAFCSPRNSSAFCSPRSSISSSYGPDAIADCIEFIKKSSVSAGVLTK